MPLKLSTDKKLECVRAVKRQRLGREDVISWSPRSREQGEWGGGGLNEDTFSRSEEDLNPGKCKGCEAQKGKTVLRNSKFRAPRS